MPPILTEEPPVPNESEEEEEEMEDAGENSAQNMDEDSIASDFEELHGNVKIKSRDFQTFHVTF